MTQTEAKPDFSSALPLTHTGRKVLAAIPCYNEELTIGTIVLKAKKYVDEVLVIDDGSKDATAMVAREAGATVIPHSENLGYGAALRSGFDYAWSQGYDMMVTLDGDGQHDPSVIPEFYDAMEKVGADIVIGSRFLENNHAIPLYRKAGLKVLDTAMNAAGNLSVSDSQSGYRMYSRRAIETIQVTHLDMAAGSEILTQVEDNNLKVAEIPITVRYDIDNTSSKNPVSHGFQVLDAIIWQIAHRRPLLYIGVPGFALTIVGIYFGLTLLRLYNQEHYFSLPLSILVAIFLILGAMGMFMGLALNVIGRVLSRHEKVIFNLIQSKKERGSP